MLCREEMAQTRYHLVCFPCEEKRPFYLFFRNLADIFNLSSFLLSTCVSYGVTVRKDRAVISAALFLRLPKNVPALTCVCHLKSPWDKER